MSISTNPMLACRVEVSGWDCQQTFFVEKTIIDWMGHGKPRTSLRAKLLTGAMLFVRALDHSSPDTCFPVAYLIDAVQPGRTQGYWEFDLVELRPRRMRAESTQAEKTSQLIFLQESLITH